MARAPKFPGSTKTKKTASATMRPPSVPQTRTFDSDRVAAVTREIEDGFDEKNLARYEALLDPVLGEKDGKPDLNAATRNRDALDSAFRWANEGRIWAERALKEWERREANGPEQKAISLARAKDSECPLSKSAERSRVISWVMHHHSDRKLELQQIATKRERMAFAVKRFTRLREAFEKRATGLERILSAYTTTSRR